ncbi:MAG: hypothetical protein R3D85_00585 [Paracoccaceae bacterium]
MSEAVDIYQAHLDTVSQALFRGDFDAVTALMHYPSAMETDDDWVCIDSAPALLPSLRSFRETLSRLGVTEYHRICRGADFAQDDPDRIEGLHETYALRHAVPAMPPYLNRMTLIRRDGIWLGAGIRAAARNTDWTIIQHDTTGTIRPARPATR